MSYWDDLKATWRSQPKLERRDWQDTDGDCPFCGDEQGACVHYDGRGWMRENKWRKCNGKWVKDDGEQLGLFG